MRRSMSSARKVQLRSFSRSDLTFNPMATSSLDFMVELISMKVGMVEIRWWLWASFKISVQRSFRSPSVLFKNMRLTFTVKVMRLGGSVSKLEKWPPHRSISSTLWRLSPVHSLFASVICVWREEALYARNKQMIGGAVCKTSVGFKFLTIPLRSLITLRLCTGLDEKLF